MQRNIKNSRLVQSTIDNIIADKSESVIWKDFLLSKKREIDRMYQDYLRDLAFEKLRGSKEILSQSTEDMPFTTRVKAILIANGITDVKTLISHSYMELSRFDNLGRVSLEEIEEYVEKIGFHLEYR